MRNTRNIAARTALLVAMGCASCAGKQEEATPSDAKQETPLVETKEQESTPENRITPIMMQSKVLSDPSKRVLFTGYEKLQVLPPENVLEAMADWFVSDEAEYFVTKNKHWKEKNMPIAELRKITKIGVPYEIFELPGQHLEKHIPIQKDDLIFTGRGFPLIRNDREIRTTFITLTDSGPSLSWGGGWRWPEDNFLKDKFQENSHRRVKLYSGWLRLECYGIHLENTDIDTGMFSCSYALWGKDDPVELPSPLTFREVCAKAQEVSDQDMQRRSEDQKANSLNRER